MKLLYFGKADCGPCKMTRPFVERFAADRAMTFTYMDVAEATALSQLQAHGFRAVPAVVVLNEHEEEVASAVGGPAIHNLRLIFPLPDAVPDEAPE